MTMSDASMEAGSLSGRRLPYTLTILATYQCTAACKHCCFHSSPRVRGRVPQERLLKYIDEASDLGTINLVCFSGGESFLLGKDLVELVQRCSEHKLVSRVVTNGYWAQTESSARQRLEPLIEAGLNEINFSTGDDHSKYVSVEVVVTGMAVSREYGLTTALMIEERIGRSVTKETVWNVAQSRYPQLFADLLENRVHVVESPWMEFIPGEKISYDPGRLVNSSNVHRREPCKSILTTVVVTPNENLGMCCGLPREELPDLCAGSLRDKSMRSLIDGAMHDFLKIWLFVEGPERILAWAATHDPTIEWENMYAHNCDACRAMYHPKVQKVIAEHHREKLDEVLAQYAVFLQSSGAFVSVSESRDTTNMKSTQCTSKSGDSESGLVTISNA